LLLLYTLGLESAQFGGFFVAASGKARFLQVQVTDLLFVGDEGVRVDQVRTGGGLVLFEQLSEFEAAFGEQSHFENRDAAETPIGIGDRLHEIGFLVADGRELFRIRREVALVFGGIVTGEQDGAAGERGFDGVQGRSGFAFAGRSCWLQKWKWPTPDGSEPARD
jgi:hypothetical protein